MSAPIVQLFAAPPAGTALGRIARQAVRFVIAIARAVMHRREVTDLLTLDERQLKDIGLVRSDVLGALAAPVAADPSILLRLRSVENRARVREVMAAGRAKTREPGRTRRAAADAG